MANYTLLPFIDRVKQNQKAFGQKVIVIANSLGISPNWLMIVMNNETVGTFSPSIKNPLSTATGLIQFLESTAKSLGTSTAQLAKMSNVEQLDYVKKYFQKYASKINSLPEAYLAVFYPAALGKPKDWMFPKNVVAVNKIFDITKDGQLSRGEFDQYVLQKYGSYLKNEIELEFDLKKKLK